MTKRTFTLLVAMLLAVIAGVHAQPTAFTYQGRLDDGGNPASGSYDIIFTLHDAASAGNVIGGPVTNAPTIVSTGLFTVTLDFGNQFPGDARWLEIAVRTNGGGAFTTLAPRQPLTSTPYALRALNSASAASVSGNVPATQLTGVVPLSQLPTSLVTNGASDVSISGTFAGNGSGLTGLDASQITGGIVPSAALSNAWQVGGNAGTTPALHFLGTTDNSPIEIRVNNLRALRIEPAGLGPNLIGGNTNNSIGELTDSATISGGSGNQIGTNNLGSVIAGGRGNRIGTNSLLGTVSGGSFNRIADDSFGATIAGGTSHYIGTNANSAAIGGGTLNIISAGAIASTIPGGSGNWIRTNAAHGTIGGGRANQIGNDSRSATIAGGDNNSIGTNSTSATISGGFGQTIVSDAPYSIIAGGRFNLIGGGATGAFAAGTRAYALHPGSYVWADFADFDAAGVPFSSTTANQFSARAVGGVRFETAGAGMTLDGQPVLAGTVNSASLADDAVTSTKIADGSVQSADIAAGTFNTTFWRAGGNSGTTAGTHFLGTTDKQPLELRVNNLRALQLEATSNGWINLVVAPSLNSNYIHNVGVGILAGSDNVILTNSSAAVIAGGRGHTISNAPAGTIGGGLDNFVKGLGATVAGGNANSTLGSRSTIAGGSLNLAVGDGSTIGGGSGNATGNPYATVGGGLGNVNRSPYGVLGGGYSNVVIGSLSVLGGGDQNLIAGLAAYAAIPGGQSNAATADYTFAAGRRAKVNHSGSFVWADDHDADFPSTTNRQFSVRANNGVVIQATNTALELRGGGALKVVGAGVNTATPVFTHRAAAGNITGSETRIDHPLCNGRNNAILIITYNFNPAGIAGTRNDRPFGLYYTGTRWAIYNLDGTAMPVGAAYNVLVFNP
jgi:hypothetical protein